MAAALNRAARRGLLLATVVAVLAGSLARLTAGPRPVAQPTTGSTSPSVDRYLGEVAPDERIEFSVLLNLPGQPLLEQFLSDVRDRHSTAYGHYLTAAEVGARFGLPDAALARLEQDLVEAGLTIVERFPQRTAVRVAGSGRVISQLIGTPLGRFQDELGREYRRPVGTGSIPAELRPAIAGLSGLDTSGVPMPHAAPLFDVPAAGLRPIDIERAYEMTRLRQAAALGEGEYIAVVSFDTFLESDIDTFDAAVGISGPKVEKISIGAQIDKPGPGSVEVNLDIDVIRMIAPSAQILDFETSDGSYLNADMVREVVKDGRAKIATISWGWCASEEVQSFGADALQHEDTELMSAVAAGVNVFLAVGDSGPYSCRHGDISNTKLDPDATGSSPNIIDVGGTRLSVREDGTYLEEVAWEWPLRGEAGGGGQTKAFAKPSWQVGPGVENKATNGFRQAPDVAGPADCYSSFYISYTDPKSGALRDGARGCGTSAASPYWAAIAVLMQRYARDQGIAELGYLNPTFYALAAEAAPNAIFHDVNRGANLGFDAGPGWDFATGLGSPRVDALTDALVAYLKRR